VASVLLFLFRGEDRITELLGEDKFTELLHGRTYGLDSAS